MYFDSDPAFAFLEKNQFVFTCRAVNYTKKNISTIEKVQIYRHGKPAGLAGNKVFVWTFSLVGAKDPNTIYMAAMHDYVCNSGFASVAEWVAEAQRLSGKKEDWVIYYVHVSNTDGRLGRKEEA